MTWKTLGESLEAALASMMNDAGEGSGGTLPDAMKGTGTDEGAGQVVVREVVPTSSEEQAAPVNLGNAKGRPVHHKAPPQRRTGQPLTLYVIEGGSGRPTGGGNSRAAYRAATGEGNRAREFLKLVGG